MKKILLNNSVINQLCESIGSIKRDILKKRTSLGDNEIFPPDDEKNFQLKLIENEYNDLEKRISEKYSRDVDVSDLDDVSNRIGDLLVECKSIEEKHKNELESFCARYVIDLFGIPDDLIELNCELTNKIDASNERDEPEETSDFEFDSISDIDSINKEIYKRRAVNSLIEGISNVYSSNIKDYVKELYEIDSSLPELYEKIILFNNFLIYSDKPSDKKKYDAGTVSVEIFTNGKQTKITSYGIIFPVLLNETIKGVLELISSHGLPDKKEYAEYILKKSDFKLAEEWDIRFGIPIWKIIEKNFDGIENDMMAPIFDEIVSKPVDEFNLFMRENLAKTKKGKEMDKEILSDIEKNKKYSDFEDYAKIRNSEEGFENDFIDSDNFNNELIDML